jgi:glutamate-1-semialdehyde 2,1-aminomutase
LPESGFHRRLRELTRAAGTLLVIDETHTICAGPGGATAAWGLEPDFLVIGKPIGGGVPCAAYGTSADIARALAPQMHGEAIDVSRIGGTLAGNALALAAMRAALSAALRTAPRNGRDAASSLDHELEAFLHLYALNHGVLLTPFHNMALFSPQPTAADVDRHSRIFAAAVEELCAA